MDEITKDNIDELMVNAIIKKDEPLIKELIIRGMQIFLENPENYTKECLDILGSMYLHIPIHEKWTNEFKFKDSKLRYVLEELSAIETVSDERAKEIVKRFVLYLQDKEYEKI